MNRDNAIEIMKSRGFSETIFMNDGYGNPSKSYFSKLSKDLSTLPQVIVHYPSGNFEIVYITTIGGLKLTTGELSPLYDNNHFNRFFSWMTRCATALKNELDK